MRLIWAHMRLEFGVVRPNILFGRTGATENVSGIIIIIYFFTEQSIHNIVITTEEAVNNNQLEHARPVTIATPVNQPAKPNPGACTTKLD